MGAKNLVMLKTHIDSIKLCFANDFVYENVVWPLASIWVFFSNYVVSSMRFIFTYFFRFQRKKEHFEDYEINRFTEELANFLFPRCEDFHKTSEEIDWYILMEKNNDIDMNEDVKKIAENETESSVFFNCASEFPQDGSKRIENVQEEKAENNAIEDDKKRVGKTEGSIFSIECVSNVNEDVKKIDENETESSVFKKCEFDFHQDGGKRIEKVQEEEIVGFDFKEQEPMKFRFSFLQNFTSEYVSHIAKEGVLEHNLVQAIVSQEEEEKYVQEHCEEFECESLKAVEDTEKTQYSIDIEVSQKAMCKNEREEEYKESIEKSEETIWENEIDEMEYDEDEDDEEEEDEWKHDELVEQIKLELRNARQGGLATIFEDDEERESPKIVRELIKPLSIEEKMEYKDHIVEIQKVYRCYAEKMRKLDVLNYQAMQTIGLLQLKDPMQMPKSTVQHAKPLVSQNLWPRKAPKQKYDPLLKLVHEVHRDLELVYVGQVCLSWEILCWQHRKIQELKKYDSQHQPHRYNLVAGEFQLFQVVVQRFIEDEPFQQGPRIQNYVANRFVVRNLLQVPPIKDDSTKDKKKVKWSEVNAITSERLAYIIKECMQVFWDFVRADKDEGNTSNNVSHRRGNDGNEKEISDLLRDIQTQLQKKERKLKDKLRSGNCIVRKFQKQHESKIQLNHDLLLAQVGLRLISRVINMKKLRIDQLVWCSEKLNQIKFVDREIQVEHSFLLFPC